MDNAIRSAIRETKFRKDGLEERVDARIGDDARRVRRAWLGVAGTKVRLSPEAAHKVGAPEGIRIASVVAGSPAAEAGARPGDIVMTLSCGTVTQLVPQLLEALESGPSAE